MATYVWRCQECGEEHDETLPIGTARTIKRCTCGAKMLKVLGVGLGIHSDALPNKRHGVRAINSREAAWDVDMPAYRRMRTAGLQPPGIDGSARMEDRVGDQTDIDHRDVIPEKGREPVKEQIAELKETFMPHPKIGAT